MPLPSDTRLHEQSQTVAEFVFLFILIILMSGPLSGAVLGLYTSASSVLTKGATQFESTKNLASQVLERTEKIRVLEKKVAQQELELTRLKQQSRDTNQLRALLNLKQKSARVTVAADVIARNPDNWFEQIVVDKGTADLVRKGSGVITSTGVVGQVVSCEAHSSVIKLITDPDLKLGVNIQRLGLTGILSGNMQNLAKIDWIPVGTNVDIGDKIVCLGSKGGAFPENHPVGTVAAIRRDTNGASMQIEVKLAENCYDLNQVLIVPPLED